MKKKRILFLLNSLCFGGAEQQTIDLVNHLDRNKFEIGLVYLDKHEENLPQLKESSLLFIKCLNRTGKLDFKIVMQLEKLINNHYIDIVFCVNEYAVLYAWLCKKIFKLHFSLVAAIHHTLLLPGGWRYVKNMIYRRLLNQCDSIVFVCKKQSDYWAKMFGINSAISRVIYNGIDLEKFFFTNKNDENVKLSEKLGLTADIFVVGICSVLRPVKRHKDFIDAILFAVKQGLTIRGLIIGDGPERTEIEQHIKTKGAHDYIIMTGFQEDVRPYMDLCDCMVLTSESEAFSMAALESMALRKPMIMSDVGGAAELIEHGKNGYLYEKGDTAALAKLLINISDKKTRRKMSQAAFVTVQDKYSLRKMVFEYEKFLITLN